MRVHTGGHITNTLLVRIQHAAELFLLRLDIIQTAGDLVLHGLGALEGAIEIGDAVPVGDEQRVPGFDV